ncbi:MULTISPECIES: pseudouridine synthase [Streptomyces]|uniref:pseudouridine synthase n=1 Tax=Streptomyces TaxID=1883 RepID=UPI002249445A|nr:pseudouridine synthase [Streptomyces sp. JHD 1]MCX2970435.1 pseudouridine synthase [Streptomyces sp. JHD 1]
MRSSGRNSNRNNRGAGSGRDDRRRSGSGRPRPEERRYPTAGSGGGAPGGKGGKSPGGQGGQGSQGSRGGQGGQGGKGGPGGGPKPGGRSQGGGGKPGSRAQGGARRPRRSAPARSREYDAQVEERNRARHDKPDLKLPKTFDGDEPDGERLQKVLARAGMGSRRACEELIDQARVEVNGRVVLEQGLRVDPENDEIKVDGLTVAAQSYLFFALNKPAGVVSSMEDPEGRQCLGDYVQNRETRLFHVGRLDTETEGLILLTNHGELAHRLTHPRYGVTKTYLAAIQGPIPRDLGKRLKDGIPLEDGYARADHFKVVENTGKNYLVEVALHEGRKHIVRRMLAEAGFPVDRLVRTKFGPIPLGDQKSGWLRRMTNTEVGMLMREVGL